MQAVDPWPAAPVLAELPPVARLSADFAPDALAVDLSTITADMWAAINIMTGDGLGSPSTTNDWRTIPLRSIGGDPARTDPGGPELAEFADTPWVSRLPAFRAVLESIPAPLRSARLMALGPGAESPLHSDTKVGLPWGTLRLHVPVLTLAEATLTLDGQEYCWEPGQLWYADFTRAHLVRNTGTSRRVHLVIDAMVTDELLDLFPPVFQEGAKRADYLVQQSGSLPVADPVAVECSFDAPVSFLSFEAADGSHVHDEDVVRMSVERRGDALLLLQDAKARFRLVHLGDDEFRFAGWTSERTIRVDRAGAVVLRTRRGGADEWERRLPTERPAISRTAP